MTQATTWVLIIGLQVQATETPLWARVSIGEFQTEQACVDAIDTAVNGFKTALNLLGLGVLETASSWFSSETDEYIEIETAYCMLGEQAR